jgi:sensor c-di-GMP phosphodiesterase-like protein
MPMIYIIILPFAALIACIMFISILRGIRRSQKLRERLRDPDRWRL